jgi:hypothetical protein
LVEPPPIAPFGRKLIIGTPSLANNIDPDLRAHVSTRVHQLRLGVGIEKLAG